MTDTITPPVASAKPPAEEPARGKTSTTLVIFAVVALVGAAVDLVSKEVVFEELNARPTHQTDWFFETEPISFRFSRVMNRGALWGIGQGYQWLFAVLSVVAVGGVVVWLTFFDRLRSKWLAVTLGLIVAGAVGNFYDRLALHGEPLDIADPAGKVEPAVRDFLHFRFWDYNYPVFNIADVCLVVAAIMIVIYSLFMAPSDETEKDETTADGA